MPAATQAGDLDTRVTILRATTTASQFNELVPTWSTLVTLWAKRTDASAAEAYRAQEVGAQISARFKIRYSALAAGINPKDRVQLEGRTYNITATRRIERNQWIEIDAVARDDQAT